MAINIKFRRVRALRVIEYVGTPEFVQNCLADRKIKGEFSIRDGNRIREAVIGEYPEVLETEEVKREGN